MGVPDATPVFQGRSDEGFEAFIFNAPGASSKIAFEEGKGGASFIAHCLAMHGTDADVGQVRLYTIYLLLVRCKPVQPVPCSPCRLRVRHHA